MIMVSASMSWGQSTYSPPQPPRETLFSSSSVTRRTELPNAPAYQPLTKKQKFDSFVHQGTSPYVLLDAGITTTTWQLGDDPPFGTGGGALAKGFGAAIGQRETSLFLGRFLFPALLHQDPRYFPDSEGSSKFHRAMYAASRVFMTRSDSGRQTWNGGYILGNLGSAGISNLYISNRDAGTIFTDFAIGMAIDAGYNIGREFWPAMRKKVPGELTKDICDFAIGADKPENQTKQPKKNSARECLLGC